MNGDLALRPQVVKSAKGHDGMLTTSDLVKTPKRSEQIIPDLSTFHGGIARTTEMSEVAEAMCTWLKLVGQVINKSQERMR